MVRCSHHVIHHVCKDYWDSQNSIRNAWIAKDGQWFLIHEWGVQKICKEKQDQACDVCSLSPLHKWSSREGSIDRQWNKVSDVLPETVSRKDSRSWLSWTMVPHSQVRSSRRNRIKHVTSALYHPSTNGQAKRVVQTVKQGITRTSRDSIQERLTKFLFDYRITPHATTGVAPCDLLVNRKLRSRTIWSSVYQRKMKVIRLDRSSFTTMRNHWGSLLNRIQCNN